MKRKRFLAIALSASIGIVILGATPGLPVGSKTYSENFATMGNWGAPNEYVSVSGANLVITPKKGRSRCVINMPMEFGDMDARVEASITQCSDPKVMAAAGLCFWAEDQKNLHCVGVGADGMIAVLKLKNDAWTTLRDWEKCAAIKKGLNQWNEVRVLTKGDRATIYVNGAEVISFQGQPPAQSHIGCFTMAPDDNTAVGKFRKLTVRY